MSTRRTSRRTGAWRCRSPLGPTARRSRPWCRWTARCPTAGGLLFFRYGDRPGVVGTVGTILGGAGVNIAAMQVARRAAGGEALMTLTVDSAVDAELLSEVATAIGSSQASIVDLRDE